MGRSRKVFVILVVVFALLLAFAAYDIGRRTTFPGSGKAVPADSAGRDSAAVNTR